ncbi:MAG: DUF368 domain-containing protein [Candidatus Methanomethylophilus sp.]|nr:DUF368 domain-containing protein [Methanomethylophilus sp.]
MESWTKRLNEFIVGILIGIAAMFPGISGAVLAVCFGIYERLIVDIAELRTKVREDWKFLVVLALGLLAGVFLSAKLLSDLMDTYRVIALFLFVGLIAGQVPTVYYMTRKNPHTHEPLTGYNWAALIAGLLIMGSMGVLSLHTGGGDYPIADDAVSAFIMFLVGIICAVSALAPGISHSTILIVIGMLNPFYSAIAEGDLVLVLPMLIGFVAGALLFAKFMKMVLRDHNRSTTLMIFGLTLGSLISLTLTSALEIVSTADILGAALACVVGAVVSLWFVRLGLKYDIKE